MDASTSETEDAMADLGDLLSHLEQSLNDIETLDESTRGRVLELLDGVDAVHRMALAQLGEQLGAEEVERLRAAHPAIAWLMDAYGIGVDQHTAAEEALEEIRPYIHSHGGQVHVLSARDGVVQVQLSGSCSGCTASAVTLQEGVERALREHVPGFMTLEVAEDADDATPHPPPGATLLEIQPV
jgi:Fe-S cluster biogenesis protein NfuA